MDLPHLAAAMLTVVAVAGCLTGDGADEDTLPWWQAALPFGDGHDHGAHSHHAGRSTPNIEVRGHDPLSTETYGAPSGGYYCGDRAQQGDRTIVAVHSFFSDVAIVVTDVTDPTEPFVVGELRLPRTQVWDAEMTEDGRFAVLATSPLDAGAETGPVRVHPGHIIGTAALSMPDTYTTPVQWRSVCGPAEDALAELPLAPGLVLVDLRDLAAPMVADFVPQPVLGGHSIHGNSVGGTNYVLAATTNLQNAASYYTVYTVLDTEPARLLPYAVVPQSFSPDMDDLTGTNGHVDGFVQEHAVTGDVLLYVASWDQGVGILDLGTPGVPQVIGTWNDHVPGESHTGAWHTVYPLPYQLDGRHITVIGQEIYAPIGVRPTGQVVLMDTTDPTNPEPLARWTLPFEPEWERALWSTHYLTMVGTQLWVAMNHGGVWVADASPENWPELPSIGAFIPDKESDPAVAGNQALIASSPDFLNLAPFVGDVVAVNEDTVAAFDTLGGVYTLRLDASVDVPEAPPWSDDRWIPTG